MKIEHVALWVRDLEKMREFYETYFNGTAGEKYHNDKKAFESYFLSFDDNTRLEIMRQKGVDQPDSRNRTGFAHIAFSLGSKEKVDQMTKRLTNDNYNLINGPRTTGDGYYESVIEDPEGNLLELTI
ncbi:VOC family protein [Corticicoccus populi]|uniref:VOC family protein n=1 Tax=Corticicoccus populi TaxID=1812821 RepID=A0ABW5WWS2_9STAP